MGLSVYRLVIIALLGPCLWGHLDKTQGGRCYEQKEHFHLLCEIRVSNLIMTQGHSLHTLEERKWILLELSASGWPRLRSAWWRSPGTYLWQTPESCDMLGYLLDNISIVLKGLPYTENTFHKLKLAIRAFSGYVAARHHCYIPIFQSKTSKLITSEPLAHYELLDVPLVL